MPPPDFRLGGDGGEPVKNKMCLEARGQVANHWLSHGQPKDPYSLWCGWQQTHVFVRSQVYNFAS